MSQEYVTHADLDKAIQELEGRLSERSKRLEDQVSSFMAEMRASFGRNLEEARDGRGLLIDSNDRMVTAFRRVEERADRAEAGSDRHRASTALAIKSIDDGFKALSREVVVAVKDLGKQIQEIKEAVARASG